MPRDRDRVTEGRRTGRGLEPAAGDHEASLEGGVGQRRAVRRDGAPDEGLDEGGPGRTGGATERRRIGRDGPPADDLEARRGERLGDEPASRPAPVARTGAGQEELEDRRPLGGEAGAGRERLDDGRIERDRHAGAVGRRTVGSERAAVSEGRQAAEPERQDLGQAAAAGVGDEPDPAGIVLERGVVERRERIARPGSGRPSAAGLLWWLEGHCWVSVAGSEDREGVEPTAREEPGGRSRC